MSETKTKEKDAKKDDKKKEEKKTGAKAKTGSKKVMYPKIKVDIVPNWGVKQADSFLEYNSNNRPVGKALIDRYASEMLRKKWKLNGETIVVDKYGEGISGQHRALALKKAEEMRKEDVEYYREEYGWKGPVTIPVMLVFGIEPLFADTNDTGKTRSGGDVLYRRHEFDGKYNDSDLKKLSRDLATAARTVWIRLGGKKVSDAPKFPHSELLDFLAEHPYIKKAVEHVYKVDKANDKSINARVSRGILSAMVYLFAQQDYKEGQSTTTKPKQWAKAEEFVTRFATGERIKAGNAIYELRELYTRQLSQGGSRDRDREIISPAIKAWVAWMGRKKLSSRTIKPKQEEYPRIGGLDCEIEEEVEEIEGKATVAEDNKAASETATDA